MKPVYRRMLQGMQKKEEGKSKKKRERWFVYILRCRDGTFYTGITNDLKRRCQQHNKGSGARYTRTRLPVSLLYSESCPNRPKALIRECTIKTLPRKKKEKLIELRPPAALSK